MAISDRMITYDAKDPDMKLVPIEPLRPPKGAPTPDAQKALATLFDSRASEADYLGAMQYHAIWRRVIHYYAITQEETRE